MKRIWIAGSILWISAAAPALGAAKHTAADSHNSPPMSLQEVVVTAQLRRQGLEQVPLSAEVVSGGALANHDVLSLQDLSQTIPDVTLEKGSTTNRLFIRGIGSGDNPSFDQSVSMFFDGIYHGRARLLGASLFDIKRVEVMKGPQTTYFGNNAIAGAINIIPRGPGAKPAADARLSYTPRFGAYTAEAAGNVPMPATLGLRLAGQATGGNGWVHDLATGKDVPRTRNAAVRATLAWRPSAALNATLVGQYTREREHGGLPLVRGSCPPPAQFGAASGFCLAAIRARFTPSSADFFRRTSPGQREDLTTQDYLAKVNFERKHYRITSVTGFTRYSYALDQDLDMTPLPLLTISAPEQYRQFSQEVRAMSRGEGRLQWLAGIYYQHSHLQDTNLIGYGFLSATITGNPHLASLRPYLPFGVHDMFEESSDTGSGFAALTWHMTRRLSLTGAARYTTVHTQFRQTVAVGTAVADYGGFAPLPASVAPLGIALAGVTGLATAGSIPLSRRDSDLSPSVVVQFQPTASVMLYARYVQGFKAGGFNGVDLSGIASQLPFAPEKVTDYELGVKAALLEHTAIVNFDAFRENYTDLQLAGVVPSKAGAYVNLVQNAGGVVSQGLELDSEVRLVRGLKTSLSATYLDAYYSRYPDATPTALQTVQGLHSQNLRGQRPPFAPTLSGVWSISYELPISSQLSLRLENRLFATGGMFLNFNNDPFDSQGAYLREDATISLLADHWEISLLGKNLTNRVIRTYGAALPISLGTYAFMTEPPRNLTVQVRYWL